MQEFIARHRDVVVGGLSGFDRVLFRGVLRSICCVSQLQQVLSIKGILLKDFGRQAQAWSQRVATHAQAVAAQAGRRYVYLPSAATDKEDLARQIVEREGIEQGLICVLGCVEPCMGFDVHRNRQTKKLDLVCRQRKGRFFYFYYLDRDFGLMHVRLGSWLPFDVQVCINGRSYLERQLQREGIGYQKADNCFLRIDDMARAQELLDRLNHRDWVRTLNKWVKPLQPLLRAGGPLSDQRGYYWTIRQSEVATDVLFRDAASLAGVYPSLCRHAIERWASPDVLRFLGHCHAREREVTSDLKRRVEGVRVKHYVGVNSIKMYDKQGRVLRIETTINDPSRFRVYRRAQNDPDAPPQWRKMRKGVADTARRVQVCLAANDRYLQALALVEVPTPTHRVLDPISLRVRKKGHCNRALHPLGPDDAALFAAVLQSPHLLHGLTNRDLQQQLYSRPPRDPADAKRRSSRVGRLLRLLRAHGLIHKVGRQRLYRITPKGHHAMTLALTLRQQPLKIAA